jgi:hypothetical protein
MKKLLILIAVFLLIGCQNADNDQSSSDEKLQPTAIPETNDNTNDVRLAAAVPITMALLTDNNVYFYSDTLTAKNTDSPKYCGYRCFTDGDEKVFYDASGDIDSTVLLPHVPDNILGDWVIQDVSPDAAYAAGAMYKWYSDIYLDGVSQGHWSFNRWRAEKIIETDSGEFFAIDTAKASHQLHTSYSNINHVDDLIIHNYNAVNRTATIETEGQSTTVSWSTNYFNNAKDWLFLNDIWYSWNGYEFGTTLEEEANALWGWNSIPFPISLPNGQYPTIISAGVYNNALYWIECNRGYVYKYTPATDSIIPLFAIYFGDGYRTTGLARRDGIKPAIIGNMLYYNNENTVKSVNLDNGVVDLIFAGSAEIYPW